MKTSPEVGYALGLVLGASVFDAAVETALLRWALSLRRIKSNARRKVRHAEKQAAAAPTKESPE